MERDTDPRNLVSKIKARWRQVGNPDAKTCLAQYPAIRNFKSLAVDLAYEEFCLREEAGDSIDVHRFCGRFPSIRRSLFRQIEVHHYLEQNPGWLESDWPKVGEPFLGFQVLQELGRGALARIFLCAQLGVGERQVVVKVARDGAYEADTMGRLNHANIVPVFSVVEDEESEMSCICMPFCGRSTLCDVLDLAHAESKTPRRARVILDAANVHREKNDRYDGIGLADRVLQSAPYVEGVLHLGAQLADALRHAHERGIVHGDVKPSNILITPSGKPMLLDFNLAHGQPRPEAKIGGTLPYMPPEQIRATVLHQDGDGAVVDERSDIYSLGTVLYELLCGQLPFGPVLEPVATVEVAQRLLAAQRSRPRIVSQLNPNIDRKLTALLSQSLAYEPEARPESMGALVDAISHHLSPKRRAARWTRMHRRSLLLGSLGMAGLALTVGGGAAYTNAQRTLRRIQQHRSRIQQHRREFELGRETYAKHQFQLAARWFAAALRTDNLPVWAQSELAHLAGRAHYGRGRALLKLGQTTEARAEFDKAAKSPELRARANACLGYCDNLLAKTDRAIEHYEEAITAVAGTPTLGLLNNLGHSLACVNDRTYQFSGEPEKNAVDYLQEAIAIDASSPVVIYNHVTAHWLLAFQIDQQYQKGLRATPYDPGQAIVAADNAVASWPEMPPELRYNVARLYGYAAIYSSDRAEECARRCLKDLEMAIDGGYFPGPKTVRIDPSFTEVQHRHGGEFDLIVSSRRAHRAGHARSSEECFLDPIDDDSI